MNTPFDIDAFLDQTFFGLDTVTMLNDVKDFIEFSERNIEWQKRREVRKAERQCDEEQFDDPYFAAQYRHQTIESAVYRFDVTLTQRVRYAALVSLITTIEWVLISLRNRATFAVPKKPDRRNEAVHLLEVFNQALSLDLAPQIELMETLTQVRNCIVHGAGLLESYKHGQELRQKLSGFRGISVSSINFLGEGVEIEHGYLQAVVEDAKGWLPTLEKIMHENGLLPKWRPCVQ